MDSEYTENIIRIQKNIRGFLERKRLIGTNAGYYKMITSKKLRILNNYGVFYDFHSDINRNNKESLEEQALTSDYIIKNDKVAKNHEESSKESGSKSNNSSCSSASIEKLIEQYEEMSGINDESKELKENSLSNSQNDPIETLVFEGQNKVVADLEEIFEDFLPPSVSFIIIVEDFIEKKIIPLRQRVVCGTFEISIVEVTKFEVNLAKPCCEIKVLEGVMQKIDNNVGKIRNKEVVEENFMMKSQGFDVNDEKFKDKIDNFNTSGQEWAENNSNLSSLSYSSSKSEIKFSPFIDKSEKKVENPHSPLKKQHSKLSASNKSKSSDESLEKAEPKSKHPEKDTEPLEELTKTNELTKEKLIKNKAKISIKDLLKQNAPNTQEPIKVPQKPSIFPLPADSNSSPSSTNQQFTVTIPQKQSKNLNIDVQILPFEFNFLHKLGHKHEDPIKPEYLDLIKQDFNHKIQKRAKDKFYPYEKWTQVLPKLKKPQIVYSNYKDYGFLSDHRTKKPLVSGKSGEPRMISSGSDQNLIRFRKKLPKFSSYKINLGENTEEKPENGKILKEIQSAKLKKGRINDLYHK